MSSCQITPNRMLALVTSQKHLVTQKRLCSVPVKSRLTSPQGIVSSPSANVCSQMCIRCHECVSWVHFPPSSLSSLSYSSLDTFPLSLRSRNSRTSPELGIKYGQPGITRIEGLLPCEQIHAYKWKTAPRRPDDDECEAAEVTNCHQMFLARVRVNVDVWDVQLCCWGRQVVV